ncbi:membrane protein [Methylobacterium sp. 4-46]|uniref:lysylphosphatidylglycerol synthase domain-containing protein n=1 Tax=unclassified Methylobacterium TaxID=2615210 RepID=UPI000152DCB6|nr:MULTISPECIES: lysylphosphatidylglycerol synthase domain-containing protein [Methylobacterium]ACA17146.1 membrane protein [Methylobacterium sp. 4-46]WFT82830.1 lysylphosphatidylglycerol synthase domain-containing protein [Methylobacterium nodulans]
MSGGPPAATRRLARALMRRVPLIGALAGLVLALWLVSVHDLSAVATAFGRIGPAGLAAVVLVRALVVLLCGLAWARVAGVPQIGAGPFVLLRFVREGVNVLLPVASVGGEVLGGRLLTFWGVAGPVAAAGIVVDLFFQIVGLALFALFGMVLLLRVEGEQAAQVAAWCAQGLALAALVLGGFYAVQRFGGAGAVERRIAALGRRFMREASGTAPEIGVQQALDALWDLRRWRVLAEGFLLHLAAWFAGALEIWIALTCIGVEHVSLTEALVLESLSQAIRSAAFPVPSGLGVQEGGLVLLGGLFGVDPGTALALSLVKRVPDVVLGLPSLLLWQAIEGRREAVARPAACGARMAGSLPRVEG